MPTPLVIDLSHFNTNVDFAKVRASGVVGVIHKATQGSDYVDLEYAKRKPLALQAGLLWGAYHFGTGGAVADQVTNFIDVTQPDGSFLLALDFESNGDDSMSLAQAKQFLSTVMAQAGQRPVLYTGGYFNDCVGDQPDPDMAQYRLWWAQYANAPKINSTWPAYWLWQYSDGSAGPDERAVDGATPCDCSAHNGSEAQLRASWV